jgi:hypothetical protein
MPHDTNQTVIPTDDTALVCAMFAGKPVVLSDNVIRLIVRLSRAEPPAVYARMHAGDPKFVPGALSYGRVLRLLGSTSKGWRLVVKEAIVSDSDMVLSVKGSREVGKCVAAFPGVKRLQLTRMSSLGNIVRAMRTSSVISLNLSGLEVTDLKSLCALVNLQELDLSDTKVTDVTPLNALSNLCELGLRRTDADLQLSSLGSLRTLDIMCCHKVSDEGFRKLATGSPRLAALNLSYCGVSDSGLRHLVVGCPLTSLDLSFCQDVGDTGIAHLASNGSILSALNLDGTRVTLDEELVGKLMVGCPRLTVLNLGNVNLANGPGWPRVTDASVAKLVSGCAMLASLDLNGNQAITDAAVSALALGGTQLTSVNLTGCKNISQAAIKRLATVCPHINHITVLNSRFK